MVFFFLNYGIDLMKMVINYDKLQLVFFLFLQNCEVSGLAKEESAKFSSLVTHSF
jgi:hypothetical protein